MSDVRPVLGHAFSRRRRRRLHQIISCPEPLKNHFPCTAGELTNFAANHGQASELAYCDYIASPAFDAGSRTTCTATQSTLLHAACSHSLTSVAAASHRIASNSFRCCLAMRVPAEKEEEEEEEEHSSMGLKKRKESFSSDVHLSPLLPLLPTDLLQYVPPVPLRVHAQKARRCRFPSA